MSAPNLAQDDEIVLRRYRHGGWTVTARHGEHIADTPVAAFGSTPTLIKWLTDHLGRLHPNPEGAE